MFGWGVALNAITSTISSQHARCSTDPHRRVWILRLDVGRALDRRPVRDHLEFLNDDRAGGRRFGCGERGGDPRVRLVGFG